MFNIYFNLLYCLRSTPVCLSKGSGSFMSYKERVCLTLYVQNCDVARFQGVSKKTFRRFSLV